MPQPAAPLHSPECPAGRPPGTTESLARPPAHAAPAPPRQSWPAAPATHIYYKSEKQESERSPSSQHNLGGLMWIHSRPSICAGLF